MTFWNVACRTLVSYFLQSDLTYSCKKNGNNKIIECLSNDSTVFISVPLCLCKEFHIVYNCYQFELVSVVLFDFNIILPLWIIFNVLRSSQMNKVN